MYGRQINLLTDAITIQDRWHCHALTGCYQLVHKRIQKNTTLSKNCCLGNPNFLHLAIQFFVYGGHSLDKKDIYCSLKFIASNHITLTRPIYIYFITDVQWFYILEKNLLLIYSFVEYKIINLKHHLMDACSSNVDKPFQECILSIP